MRFSNDIRSLRGVESGARAFILGNGPSINQENLSLLNDEIVIGMNASTLLERKFNFKQTYYVCSDVRFIQHQDKRHLATSALNSQTKRVLRMELREFDDPALEERTWYLPAIGRDGFSLNLAAGFFFGCSTTVMALQLAHYLGVRNVYILGVDLRYTAGQSRFYKEKVTQLEDANTSVQIFNIVTAMENFKNLGGNLFNCSMHSFLASYVPTVSLNDAFTCLTHQ